MSRSTLNASYILLVGIIVVVIALAVLLGQPLVKNISEGRAQIAQQAQHLAERKIFLESIDRRRAQLLSYQTEEQQLKVMIPSEERTSDILRLINSAADSSGGRVLELSNRSRAASRATAEANRNQEQKSSLAALGFTVNYRGTYEQARRFIEELETAPRPLDIIGLQMQASDGEDGELSTTFELRFYKLDN